MPKVAAAKSNRKSTAAAAATAAPTGARPAKVKAGMRKKDVVPSKPKASSSSKAPKTQAVILKAPAKPAKKALVISSPEASEDDGDDDESYPADGMDIDNDDDEEPSPQVKELIAELAADDGTDDDEEMDADAEAVAEEPPAAKKTTRNAQLVTGTPVLLTNQKKRQLPVPASPAQDDAAEDGSVSEGPFTPYVPRINPKDPSKPLLSLQTPTTKSIAKKSQRLVRADIAAKQAFPDDDARVELAERSIIRVAKELGAERRIVRIEMDPIYRDHLVKLVLRAGTQVRGETANTARDIVGTQYALASKGTPDQIKLFVEFLLSQGNFLYHHLAWEQVDPQTIRCTARGGPYRHAIIDAVIAQEFFHGHERMALADETAALFNPMPLPVVAFAATAVQCALRDWSTGVRVKSSTSFSSDEWADTYQGHLRELERMRQERPVDVDTWMRWTWKKAWNTTRQHLANGANTAPSFITTAELDDFSDVAAAMAAE